MLTTIRRTLLIGIPIALFLILGAWLQHLEPTQTASEIRSPVIVAEDDPSWDCKSMGNHLCGPIPAESRDAAIYDIGVAELAMRRTCYGATVWAEANPAQPGGYEVLGDCPPA